jgi:hypothetical protein
MPDAYRVARGGGTCVAINRELTRRAPADSGTCSTTRISTKCWGCRRLPLACSHARQRPEKANTVGLIAERRPFCANLARLWAVSEVQLHRLIRDFAHPELCTPKRSYHESSGATSRDRQDHLVVDRQDDAKYRSTTRVVAPAVARFHISCRYWTFAPNTKLSCMHSPRLHG